MVIESIRSEFERYRSLTEQALAQASDEDLHRIPGEDANSLAVILNHISGNLQSRFLLQKWSEA